MDDDDGGVDYDYDHDHELSRICVDGNASPSGEWRHAGE
jgi:hypothetical protein